jgi:ketosteroid isomerase-like protein
MAVTPDYVREVFKGLENGDGAAFFTHVADDVDWTVMGTHPLAGRYRSKADFIAGTFTKLFLRELSSTWNILPSKATRQWSNFIPWRRQGTA